MESIKTFLRLGVCTVFVISLMYGLPACEKKEAPEQAQEKTQEMMKGSETLVPEVQEKVEEAKEQVEEMAEEVKGEGKELIEEGKEEVGEMHEMMEGSGAKMQEMEGSQPKE
jgi:hypothetical protein